MQQNIRIKPLALAAMTMILSLPALADDTVLIGLAGPLTGPSARIGKDLENGARLAIADANAQKPTLNGKPVTFKLVSEDDQSDPHRRGRGAAFGRRRRRRRGRPLEHRHQHPGGAHLSRRRHRSGGAGGDRSRLHAARF